MNSFSPFYFSVFSFSFALSLSLFLSFSLSLFLSLSLSLFLTPYWWRGEAHRRWQCTRCSKKIAWASRRNQKLETAARSNTAKNQWQDRKICRQEEKAWRGQKRFTKQAISVSSCFIGSTSILSSTSAIWSPILPSRPAFSTTSSPLTHPQTFILRTLALMQLNQVSLSTHRPMRSHRLRRCHKRVQLKELIQERPMRLFVHIQYPQCTHRNGSGRMSKGFW